MTDQEQQNEKKEIVDVNNETLDFLKYSVVSSLNKEELEKLKEIRKNIIEKIELVLNTITAKSLKRAPLSSRGSTLKSLMNAYHLVQIHLDNKDDEKIKEEARRLFFNTFKEGINVFKQDEKITLEKNEDDKELVLQKFQQIVLKQREKFFNKRQIDL